MSGFEFGRGADDNRVDYHDGHRSYYDHSDHEWSDDHSDRWSHDGDVDHSYNTSFEGDHSFNTTEINDSSHHDGLDLSHPVDLHIL